MNKEVTIIGGAIIGGAVSNGVSALLPQSDSPLLNIVVAGASGFGATKVRGTSTKDNLLKGALLGSAVVQVLTAIKKISEKNFASKLTGDGKAIQFAKGAMGLACPFDEGGLNGVFMGADGQMYERDETGLHGTYMDEHGNVFEDNGLNGAEETVYVDEFGNVIDGLHGAEEVVYVDEFGNVIDGLHGAESDIYGIEDEHGLHGAEDDLYEDIYVNQGNQGNEPSPELIKFSNQNR